MTLHVWEHSGLKLPALKCIVQSIHPLSQGIRVTNIRKIQMVQDGVDCSSSMAEQRELSGMNRGVRRSAKKIAPLLPWLLLLGVSALITVSASGVDTKLLRRGRRNRSSSRTLSDHSISSMPHGFYSTSSDVSRPHAIMISLVCSLTLYIHAHSLCLCKLAVLQH